MIRRTPDANPTYTLFPDTSLVRSPVHVELRGVDLHRRLDARQPPRDQPPGDAVAVEHRQRLARVMPEPGIRFLTFVRQRHPGLDAVHRTAVGPPLLEALGIGDTPARGPPVDLARPRSDTRRVGKGCFRSFRSWWSPFLS